MAEAGTQNNSLTPSQQAAVAARGNVLVMAGAGTGKTHTLVERCLDLICNDGVSLDEMLIVTFTEAAATELRERLREGLEEAITRWPDATHLPEQLALFDAAHIGTLHGFCFKLIREHFHALGLDPQLSVLDEAQARLLADEILEEQFQSHYEKAGEWTDVDEEENENKPSPHPNPLRSHRMGAEREQQVDALGSSGVSRQVPGAGIQGSQLEMRLEAASTGRQDAYPTAVAAPLAKIAIPANPQSAIRNPQSPAVLDLITVYGNGRDDGIRALVLRLHHYIQTRADAETWLARQIESFSSPDPTLWREWYLKAALEWRDEWLPILKSLRAENVKAGECLEILESANVLQTLHTGNEPGRDGLADREVGPTIFEKIAAADRPENYPPRKKTVLRKPLEAFFDDAEFLGSLVAMNVGQASCLPVEAASSRVSDCAQNARRTGRQDACPTALREDWEWSRGPMRTLLLLVKEFSEKFSARKRADGVVDFHDLEQFAIKLLWTVEVGTSRCDVPARAERAEFSPLDVQPHSVAPLYAARTAQRAVPTSIAAQWREKLRFIFVDEYQDINAAQDRIISALGRDNRFLVGDVKQSIYRFRLADPAIFRDYAKDPESWKAQVIPLRENFRSREGLLEFVNSVFEPLMREDIGGVLYDEQAKLRFGAPDKRGELSLKQNPEPRVEMLLREKKRGESSETGGGDDALGDLQDSDLEALTVATRLRELKNSGHLIWDKSEFRPARWSDFAVLLRSPGSKREIYAKQFASAGVPLHVERGGFYDSSEILDLLSLLQLADNPLQDVPCIAVLRSPLVACSLDELAEIRLAGRGHFWFALDSASRPGSGVKEGTRLKIGKFLERFLRWRKLARQASLSECLEDILTETHYDDLLLSRPRGEQRRANVQRFLHLAEQFDTFQRQGLFRFLRFVNAQREIEAEPEVAALVEEDAVRLMSVHQSKGLEFPVVVLADLGKKFNEQDLHGEIILDEQFGLCPRVKPPSTGGRYPSLAYWLARKNQKRELRGEEMRLLYVALTRARDTLILSGSISMKKWEGYFADNGRPVSRDVLSANSCMDWLGMWLAIADCRLRNADWKRDERFPFQGETPLMRWSFVDDSNLARGSAQGAVAVPGQPADLSVSATPALDEATIEKINEVLNWKYPFESAMERAAKTSVTALRREAAEADDEAEQPFRQPQRPARAVSSRKRNALNAADTGVAHHKFLQHFSFETVTDLKSFAAEAKRLEKENYLSAEEAEVLDLEALADFWSSDVGKAIRANAVHVRRELAFTAGFKPRELDEMFARGPDASLDGETIVVQGVADLVVLLPKEIWLVDFKTDDVRAKDLPEKVEFYSPQLKLYARALERIYSRPVTDCRLYFLSVRKTVPV